MKKLLFLICFCAFAQEIQAQITQGSVVATGSFRYHTSSGKASENNSADTYHSYTLSPEVGYMISNSLEVGISARLYQEELHRKTYSNDSSVTGTDYESTQKAIGAYLRKYKFVTEKIAFTGIAEMNYSVNESKNVNRDWHDADLIQSGVTNDKYNQFIAAVRPGVSFFLSEKISLNTTFGELSYRVYTFKHETVQEGSTSLREAREEKNHAFDLNLSSSSFSLGISYFF